MDIELQHPAMIRKLSFNLFAACLLAFFAVLPQAFASDQAKSIVNALDPKSMNDLFDVSRRQPDAALTNIAPTSPNTFRFLFVWPASNPVMTYDRVGRSFTERFGVFAGQLKLLASGFCLPSPSMYFGTAAYGEEEVNIAYRDIEVRYFVGWRPPCTGRFIPIAEIEKHVASAASGRGYAFPFPALPPQHEMTAPEEGLKPFLNPQPAPPLRPDRTP